MEDLVLKSARTAAEKSLHRRDAKSAEPNAAKTKTEVRIGVCDPYAVVDRPGCRDGLSYFGGAMPARVLQNSGKLTDAASESSIVLRPLARRAATAKAMAIR